MKYEATDIITHRKRRWSSVMTSSLETKVKHIKRTWIHKISWLCNSLLSKAGNIKQASSYLSPSKHSVQSSVKTNVRTCQESFYSEVGISPTPFFLHAQSLRDLVTELPLVEYVLHNTCLEHEVRPYKGSDSSYLPKVETALRFQSYYSEVLNRLPKNVPHTG